VREGGRERGREGERERGGFMKQNGPHPSLGSFAMGSNILTKD